MDVFVARQPIFDQTSKVFAYELLFRSGPENYFTGTDFDASSSRVISDGMMVMGLDSLTGGKRAFMNFARSALVNDFAMVLPHDRVVVEILETVEPDKEVVAAVIRLKEAGYQVALDDFVDDQRYAPLLDLVDFVKVDFLATADPASRAAVAARLAPRGIRLVAEKVETREAVDEATASGYTFFQGYFFARPIMVPAKDVPGFRLNYLRLLKEINEPRTNLDKLEAIMKQEVSMAFRVLRYINSAAFGFRSEVTSIRHALVLMGEGEVRRWASVWAMAGLGKDRPLELVVTSTLRAKFCELLAIAAGLTDRQSEMFLAGMFSVIDAIIGRPIDEILKSLSVPADVRDALLGRQNGVRAAMDCALAYERGDWAASAEAGGRMGVAESAIAESYLTAASWSRGVFGA